LIYQGIIITGSDETEVSTIIGKFCTKPAIFVQIPVFTTRKPISSADQSQFTSISKEQFQKLGEQKSLLLETEINNDLYGISKKEFDNAMENGKVPVVGAIPAMIKEYLNQKELSFLTVFLCSQKDKGKNPLQVKSRSGRKEPKDEQLCLYTIVNMKEGLTIELLSKLWEYRLSGGLLPQKLISLMIESGMLLENADISNATGAAYDLTLDNEYYHNGKIQYLDEVESFIKMKPGDYALVGSKEIANLPRDVAGRFGLSVGLFMQGIILSNGPQIDPGFKGRLYCLLFNTSSQEIQLKLEQHYATIEFAKLLEPTIVYEGRYQEKNNISEYLQRSVPSSAIGELRKDIAQLKKEKWWIKILPLTISVLSIVIAILALLKLLI
jgi:deoxycytidine triphosphate deaminase/guanylate kinase